MLGDTCPAAGQMLKVLGGSLPSRQRPGNAAAAESLQHHLLLDYAPQHIPSLQIDSIMGKLILLPSLPN